METLADLIHPGDVVLLTTVGVSGPSTRPVIVQQDVEGRPGYLAFLTGGGRKLSDLGTNPAVTISAVIERGWVVVEGEASAAPEPGGDKTRISVSVRTGRFWPRETAGSAGHRAQEVQVA